MIAPMFIALLLGFGPTAPEAGRRADYVAGRGTWEGPVLACLREAGPGPSLAADLEHGADLGGDPLLQAMAGGLGGGRPCQDAPPRRQAAPGADCRFRVQLVVVQQAQVELPVGGETHAVATSTVGLAHRADEADHLAVGRALKAIVARLVGRIAARDGQQRPQRGLDPLPALPRGHVLRKRNLSLIPPRLTAPALSPRR